MEKKLFWTEDLVSLANVAISNLKDAFALSVKQVNNLDEWINIFRETDNFLKVLSPKEIKKINISQREFPRMLADINEVSQCLNFYEKNLRETSVEGFMLSMDNVQKIFSYIKNELESVRSILDKKAGGKKIFGMFYF